MTTRDLAVRRRFALWRAYDGLCVYCREPVSFADLSIDHILPERLRSDSDGLHDLLAEYGLPVGFSIDAVENLLPAHQRCNREKGGQVLSRGAAHHYLAIARARVGRAQAEEERLVRSLAVESLVGKLAAFYPEASDRNGETLSVRVAFVQPDLDRLGEKSWWEILEIAYYSELYGETFEASGLTSGWTRRPQRVREAAAG